MNNENNPQQNNIDQAEFQETVEAQPVFTVPVATENKRVSRSKKKIFFALLAIVLVFGTASGVYVFVSQPNDAAQPSQIQDKANQTAQPTSTPTANVSDYLLESSKNIKGVAVGYVKTSKSTAKTNIFEGRAFAEDLTVYDPVVFYTNQGNIFSLNTKTKETKQVTRESGSEPVFSSKAQILAYNQGACRVAVLEYKDNSSRVIQEGAIGGDSGTDGTCYKPTGWSPDGKNLAIAGTYSKNSPDLGLVSFTDIYIYNTDTKAVKKIEQPTGFNSIEPYSLYWTDTTLLIIQHVERGKFATTLKEQLSKVNVANGKIEKIDTNKKIKPSTTQIVGDITYVIGADPRVLLSSAVGSDKLTAVSGTENIGTYILKADQSGTLVTDVFMLNGQAGTENSFKLYRVPMSGSSAPIELYSPKGFSAYMLGWGLDYNEIIYMAILSGKTEIHQYTISSGVHAVLVSDLPLVQ